MKNEFEAWLEAASEEFKLNQECSCDPGNPYYDEFGTCWYHLSKEEQERYGFESGARAAKAFFEREQLQSPVVLSVIETLNTTLNYLHWNTDNLYGDDLKGDGKLTAKFKRQTSEIEAVLSAYYAATSKANEEKGGAE